MSGMFNTFPEGPVRHGIDYVAGVQFTTDEDLAQYAVTAVSSGTAAVADAPGGGLLLSGAATTDDSGCNVQRDAAQIGLNATWDQVQHWFSITLNDAVESDLFAGLATVDTSLLASPPNDQIGFRKADGSAQLVAFVRRDGADIGTVNAALLTSGQSVALAIQSTPSQTAFWVDGVEVGKIAHAVNPLSEEVMAQSFAFQSGNNVGTKTCIVHYDLVRMNRA